MNIVLLGRPGSGKGTQATRLAAALGLELVGTSSLLHALEATETPLGEAVRDAIRGGGLVDDSLATSVVRDAVRHAHGDVLFDGFPRTVAQCEALHDVLGDRPVLAVDLEIPAREVLARLRHRLVCSRCGEAATDAAGPACPHCGAELVRRPDDDPDVVQRRLWVYERDTAPVAAWFDRHGLLVRVDATGAPDDVAARLLAAVLAAPTAHPTDPRRSVTADARRPLLRVPRLA